MNSDALFFVINRISGSGLAPRLEREIRRLCAHRKADYDLAFTEAPLHATTLAADALSNGYSKIIAVGGDGTINEVARALVNTPGVLGIVPNGSGNGLARHVGIPMKMQDALHHVFQGTCINIDTMDVNDRLSLNVSGLGFDGDVAARFATSRKRGLPGYAQLIAKGYGAFDEFEATITQGSETIRRRAFVVAFANSSQYGNNARIAPGASLCDGLLKLIVLRKFPPYRMDVLWKLFRGNLERSRWCETFSTPEARIQLSTPVAYHIDGEPAGMATDFTVRMNPGSLRLVVPRDTRC